MLHSMSALKRILILTIILLAEFHLAACGITTPITLPTSTQLVTLTITATPVSASIITPTLVPEFSTPQLIDQAYIKGEITSEERLLYLAYAIFEYDSLPSQFRSNVGWRGTFILAELNEAGNSPSIFCNLSPQIRSEFQRLLKPDTICN